MLRSFEAAALPTMVGEWSVAVTDCMTWLNGVGLPSGSLTTGVSSPCSYVPCPTRYNNHTPGTSSAGGPTPDGRCPVGPLPDQHAPLGPYDGPRFYRRLLEFALAGYSASAGWTFWNFESELPDPRWSLLEAHRQGWLPAPNLSDYTPIGMNCGAPDTIFGNLITCLILAVSFLLSCLLLSLMALCASPCVRRLCRRLGLCACAWRCVAPCRWTVQAASGRFLLTAHVQQRQGHPYAVPEDAHEDVPAAPPEAPLPEDSQPCGRARTAGDRESPF